MYKNDTRLDPVKTLNYAADLIECFGNIKLKSGLSLKDSLNIGEFSYWDVFSPELAHSYIPKILASKGPPNIIDSLKPIALSIRDFFQKKNHPRSKSNPFIHESSASKTILYIGHTYQMYRDLIHPVALRLDQNEYINTLVLRDERRPEFENVFSKKCHFQSAWDYWSDDLISEISQIERLVCKVKNDTEEFKLLVEALPFDVKYLSEHFRLLFKLFFRFYIPQIIPQVVLARKIILYSQASIVVSPDVSDSRARIYSMIARRFGIPSLDIQFGLAGDEAIEWRFLYADKVAAWGINSKEAILGQGVHEDRVEVTGSPRHDYKFLLSDNELSSKRSALGVPKDSKVFVLASTYSLKSHDKYSDPKLLIEMKEAVFDAFRDTPNAFLLVKPHPVENEAETKSLIGVCPNIIQVDRNSDIRELIKICDVFISFGSTATIDALIAKKLVICPIFPGWVFSNFFKNPDITLTPNAADQIRSIVKTVVDGFEGQIAPDLLARKKFLKRIIFSDDGKASLRIESLILGLIAKGTPHES